jgi:hypothetical protein
VLPSRCAHSCRIALAASAPVAAIADRPCPRPAIGTRPAGVRMPRSTARNDCRQRSSAEHQRLARSRGLPHRTLSVANSATTESMGRLPCADTRSVTARRHSASICAPRLTLGARVSAGWPGWVEHRRPPGCKNAPAATRGQAAVSSTSGERPLTAARELAQQLSGVPLDALRIGSGRA